MLITSIVPFFAMCSTLIYRVTQKKTEPIYFCLKFINFILALWFFWWPVVRARRGDPLTYKITPLTGWESDFRKGWSAGSATSSGHLIHQTWTPQIFICGGIWRTMRIRTILKQLVNSRLLLQQKSGKSPKRRVCERFTIFAQRMRVCLECRGGHLEHILKRI